MNKLVGANRKEVLEMSRDTKKCMHGNIVGNYD